MNEVAAGILAGSLVALMALGISLIYRTTGVLNLSQGALAALGGYVAYAASSALPMILAVAIAVVVAGAVGALIGLGIQTRLSHHSAVVAMVATLACGIVLAQLEQQIWGTTPAFPNDIGLLPVRLGFLTLVRADLWGAATAVVLAIVLTLSLRFTRTGLAIRAVADTTEGARVSGIPALRMQLIGWALAAGLAAISGFFVATPMGLLSPDFMNLYMVAALVAAVIGGLGSLPGAVAGALLISVAQSLFTYYAPTIIDGSRFMLIGSYTNTLIMLLLIAVLLLRPKGLFGGRLGREV